MNKPERSRSNRARLKRAEFIERGENMGKSLLDSEKVRAVLKKYCLNEYLTTVKDSEEVLDLFSEFVDTKDNLKEYSKSFDIAVNAIHKTREDAFCEGFFRALEFFTD